MRVRTRLTRRDLDRCRHRGHGAPQRPTTADPPRPERSVIRVCLAADVIGATVTWRQPMPASGTYEAAAGVVGLNGWAPVPRLECERGNPDDGAGRPEYERSDDGQAERLPCHLTASSGCMSASWQGPRTDC